MARFLTVWFLWCAALIPGLAGAQDYPDHLDLYVNDYAGIIAPDDLAGLRTDLARLRTETGVEMTVLTLPSRADYGGNGTIGAFATGLFNDWGIGRASNNDGILVLVDKAAREMRIELGRGYDQGYDLLARDIIDRWFLPGFRAGDDSATIRAGSAEVMTRIARRHAEGLPPEALPVTGKSLLDRFIAWLAGLVFLGIGVTIVFGRRIGDWSMRFRRCPVCGQRGLHRDHLMPNGKGPGGVGQIITNCASCGWQDDRPVRTRLSPSRDRDSGSFGGGSSSGGGASGRW